MRVALSGQALGLVMILLAGSAQADDDMAARLAAAQKVYTLGNFEGDLTFLTELEMNGFAASIAKRGGKPDDSVMEGIEKIVTPDFDALSAQKRQAYIKALAENLTIADMNDLVAFYGTPTGKKIASLRPGILRSIHTDTSPMVRATYRSAYIHHKDDFEKLGLTFAEKKQ